MGMKRTEVQNPDGTTTVTMEFADGRKATTVLDASGNTISSTMQTADGQVVATGGPSAGGREQSTAEGTYREQMRQEVAKKHGYAVGDIVARKISSAIDASNLSAPDADAAVESFKSSGRLDVFINEAKGEVQDDERRSFHAYFTRVFVQGAMAGALGKGPTAAADDELLASMIADQEDQYATQFFQDLGLTRQTFGPNYSIYDGMAKFLTGSIQKVVGDNAKRITTSPGAMLDVQMLVQEYAKVAIAEGQLKKAQANALRQAVNRARAQINSILRDPNVSADVRAAIDEQAYAILDDPDLLATFEAMGGTMTPEQFVQGQLDPALQSALSGTDQADQYIQGDIVGTTAGIRGKGAEAKAAEASGDFDAYVQAKVSGLGEMERRRLGDVDPQKYLDMAGGDAGRAQNLLTSDINKATQAEKTSGSYRDAFGEDSGFKLSDRLKSVFAAGMPLSDADIEELAGSHQFSGVLSNALSEQGGSVEERKARLGGRARQLFEESGRDPAAFQQRFGEEVRGSEGFEQAYRSTLPGFRTPEEWQETMKRIDPAGFGFGDERDNLAAQLADQTRSIIINYGSASLNQQPGKSGRPDLDQILTQRDQLRQQFDQASGRAEERRKQEKRRRNPLPVQRIT